ncbi:MFS transporter [Candidatus Lokiarchaeum ossiferum]|uniref:MFS transporter n=1 Tax=Candidatus Lokiarchaeum ossiferum TaxID=2951803 RepID=UPI00352D5A3B
MMKKFKEKSTMQVIYLMAFVNSAIGSSMIPLLVKLSQQFWPNEPFHALDMGLVISVQAWSFAIMCLLIGPLSTYIRKKTIIIILNSLVGIGIILISLINQYSVLIVGNILIGIGGGMGPIIQALISDAVAPEEKSNAYGKLAIAYTVGYAIGMLISSITFLPWNLLLALLGFVAFLNSILYLFFGKSFRLAENDAVLQKVMKNSKAKYEYKMNFESVKQIFMSKSNLLMIIEGFFSVIMFGIIDVAIIPFFQVKYAFIDTVYIVLILGLLNLVGTLIGTRVFAKISNKIGKRPYPKNFHGRIKAIIFAFSFLIFSLAFFFIVPFSSNIQNIPDFFTDAIMLLKFALILVFMATTSIFDINQPIVIEALNLPESRSTLYSTNRFIEAIGRGIGPVILGFFLQKFPGNYPIAISLSLLFVIPGIICWIFIYHYFEGDYQPILKTLNKRKQEIEQKLSN